MSRKYFGTDGIRDVAGEGMLAPDRVRALGRGVARWLSGPRRVLFGRDTRESGPWILDALTEGLLAAGHEVVDGGVLTTPAVQTLCREEGFDLAIVISASHNPAHDNGIKFFGPDGRKLPDQEEERLEAAIDADGSAAPGPKRARATRRDDAAAGGRYLRFLHRECFPELDLRSTTLVVDCAHGAASTLAPALLREFGATVVVRGNTPDGRNINEGVGVFHVEDLAPLVRLHGATLGLALDGDADRVLLVDELLGLRLEHPAHVPGGVRGAQIGDVGLQRAVRQDENLHQKPIDDSIFTSSQTTSSKSPAAAPLALSR